MNKFITFFFSIIVLIILNNLSLAKENSSSSIVIHYGLNDSHSRSWARENGDGVVGCSIFQKFGGATTEGRLFYRGIRSDGTDFFEPVATGFRLEKSVLLYDSQSSPHIFVARSNNTDQVIDHYYKENSGQWLSETITHFYNEGGKFIYELSAEKGPDGSFHLLLLKTRSDIDSDDFMDAWLNSNLYHLTNVTGSWQKELILNFNMAYTYDMYIKSSSRQDIKIDIDGYAHVVFGEQINGGDYPSRLRYGTNRTGEWKFETALGYDYGPDDDAGWFPSLCLDNNGFPHVTCMYVNRVPTKSATYCKLFFLERLGFDNWDKQIIADSDDGYYGGDGRRYTGGLTHLVFDNNNIPHIIFSDIASTHYPYPMNQRLAVGNIRYAVCKNDTWELTTIYHQPRPIGFYNATEMYGMCLIVSDYTNSIRIVGQEMVITGENQYTCDLVDFVMDNNPTDLESEETRHLPGRFKLGQNYPNPFNPGTTIMFDLPRLSDVSLTVFNILGQEVNILTDDFYDAGRHSIDWDGTNNCGQTVSSGFYFYRFQAGDFIESKKMLLQK